MVAFVSGFAPNRLSCANTDNSTAILLIAMDGTGYADLATLLAAGKKPFPFGYSGVPGLDNGMTTQYLTVENITQAKAFRVVQNWNSLTPPSASQMELIPDGIVQYQFKGPAGNVWIQKSVGTDTIELAVGY